MNSKLLDIIIKHSIIGGLAWILSGVCADSVATAIIIISVLAIWHMYYAIIRAKYFKFSFFSRKGIETIILMLLTNIAVQVPAVVIIEFAKNFAPISRVLISNLIFFGIVYLSGLTFSGLLNLLIKN